MKKYFIFSDVHGFYTELINALESAGFDKSNPEHIIISCGDLLDRGREPRKCLNFVTDMHKKNRAILIKGNHEVLMQQLLDRGMCLSHDIHNGSEQTLVDMFPATQSIQSACVAMSFDEGWLRYFANLTDYYETDHHIFTHAWIPINDNSEESLGFSKSWRAGDWDAARWLNPFSLNQKGLNKTGKKITSGHWHCSAGWVQLDPLKYKEFPNIITEKSLAEQCFKIYEDDTLIGLDTCTAYTRKINILVLDETEI